jgi:hypothetical protein
MAIMAIGLGWYLAKNTDVTGFVLFGFCPMLILGWMFTRTTAANVKVVRIGAELAIGGVIASLPLVLYHFAHGSLQAWLNDTIVSALGLTKLPSWVFNSTENSRSRVRPSCFVCKVWENY